MPVYLGLMIHNKTRDFSLIEKLWKLGLCISKHRLSQLSISMGNTVIEANEKDGVVFPMNLKLGVFSTVSVDNIDVDIKIITVNYFFAWHSRIYQATSNKE